MKHLSSVVLLLAAIAVTGCADETPLAPNPAAAVALPQLAAAKEKSVVVPGAYVVVFKGTVADVAGKTREKTTGRRPAKHTYTAAIKGYAAELSDADVAVLRADPDIAFVEPDRTVSVSTTQTGAPWGLDRLDQRALPLSGTYDYAADASGVRVYVFDTGILFGHAEFGGRAVAGIDAITPGGSAADCHGHGTHVAGTVGGATYGVAKRVQLVAVRVLDCAGNGTSSTLIAGIDWVTKQKQASPSAPMVGNLSLGGGVSAALDAAIASSVAAGITYVVAAGNSATDACLGSPSRVPEAITVGASDASDSFASFSSHGTCVDILAPGVGIASAYVGSTTAVATASGTSMATPHVAGAAALYLAGNGAATPAQVSSALLAAATTGRVANRPAGTPDRLLHTGTTTSAPPTPARMSVPLVNAASSLCLATVGGSAAPVTPGTVATCSSTNGSQLWDVPAVGLAGNVYAFNGSQCLDDFGAQGRAGDVVGLYHCYPGAPPQTWTLNAAGELRGVNNLCVGAIGTSVTLQLCTGSVAQRWTTTAPVAPPAATPAMRLSSPLQGAASGLCLATLGGSAASETRATLAACSATAASQRWDLAAVGTEGNIYAFSGSMCLDDFGALGRVGDLVGLYACYPGAAPQLWTLTAANELKGINGLCVTAAGTAAGVLISLQKCNGAADQKWTATASPPPVVPPPPTRFETRLQSAAGLCMALASATPETAARLATCGTAPGQTLSVAAVGTAGLVQLFGGVQCLDDFGANGLAGDIVGTYHCYPGAAPQMWTLTSSGALVGINGLCVVPMGTVVGAAITLQTCTGAAAQRWTALPVASASTATR